MCLRNIREWGFNWISSWGSITKQNEGFPGKFRTNCFVSRGGQKARDSLNFSRWPDRRGVGRPLTIGPIPFLAGWLERRVCFGQFPPCNCHLILSAFVYIVSRATLFLVELTLCNDLKRRPTDRPTTSRISSKLR